MLLLFVCLVISGICYGEHSIKCGEREGWSFEESRDGVEGRYNLEWCTQSFYEGKSDWTIRLYYDPQTPHKCRLSSTHSVYKETINIDLKNCTVVCLSTTFDLIFNGTCYSIATGFSRLKPNSQYIRHSCCDRTFNKFVLNDYSMDHFTDSRAIVNVYSSGDHVTAEWFLGYIPATDYIITVCPDTQNAEIRDGRQCSAAQCAVEGAARSLVRCALAPPAASYELRLAHRAPWVAGILFENVSTVLHHSNVTVANSTFAWTADADSSGAVWWAAGALLLALGAALALAVLVRPLLLRKLRERVLREWEKRPRWAPGTVGAEGAAEGAGGSAGRARVVLLYARDCAPLMDVARCLTRLLDAAGFQVFDLYDPHTTRLYAAAPSQWVAEILAQKDTRVLLLLTPAADCLHSAQLLDSARLQQPLLNRRVMYRAPHPGDALFLLALRLVADAALTAPDYRKHYVATIDSLEVEMLRDVTPLRRYVLPAAAALLLRDLQPPAPLTPLSPPSPPESPEPADGDTAPLDASHRPLPCVPPPTAPHEAPPALHPQVTALAEAVRSLHDYVRQKPDYLDEELIFFD